MFFYQDKFCTAFQFKNKKCKKCKQQFCQVYITQLYSNVRKRMFILSVCFIAPPERCLRRKVIFPRQTNQGLNPGVKETQLALSWVSQLRLLQKN